MEYTYVATHNPKEFHNALAKFGRRDSAQLSRWRPTPREGAAHRQGVRSAEYGRCTPGVGFGTVGSSVEVQSAMADLLDRITINPNQCGGRPCIRGMRIRVIDVLGLLAAGQSKEEILAEYPYLEADDIAACLSYAVRRLDHPTLAA